MKMSLAIFPSVWAGSFSWLLLVVFASSASTVGWSKEKAAYPPQKILFLRFPSGIFFIWFFISLSYTRQIFLWSDYLLGFRCSLRSDIHEKPRYRQFRLNSSLLDICQDLPAEDMSDEIFFHIFYIRILLLSFVFWYLQELILTRLWVNQKYNCLLIYIFSLS